MPQENTANRLLYRPSRRTVLKSGAGTATLLGATPVAAADQESDEHPAVDELFSALNCFERVAGTAEMVHVVDFRREGIQQLREETDDGEDLRRLDEADQHNEDAPQAVLFGQSD